MAWHSGQIIGAAIRTNKITYCYRTSATLIQSKLILYSRGLLSISGFRHYHCAVKRVTHGLGQPNAREIWN